MICTAMLVNLMPYHITLSFNKVHYCIFIGHIRETELMSD